jgi:DNA polymerase-3 subunit beta
MNITIPKSELNRALVIANSIVEKRTTMPILANVLISASEGALKVSATNLELTAVVTAKADVASGGSTTVNAKVLSDIVKELPGNDVHLELQEGERLEITSGSSQFKMLGVSAEEFPCLPGVSLEVNKKIKGGVLLEMINRTLYGVSHDETRFNLNGVCFEYEAGKKGKDGILRLVATDGHRLAMVTRESNLEFEGSAIVPTRGLSEIRRILDDYSDGEVGVEISEGFFILETPESKVSMRLIDGEFPDYNQVIPNQKGEPVVIQSGVLAKALRRAALMVTDRGKCVKFDFSKGRVRISSSSPELGESSEELDVGYDGEPLSVGFNAKYLLDFAATLNDEQNVVLELNGELGPGKFSPEGDESYIGIVMPMRLA